MSPTVSQFGVGLKPACWGDFVILPENTSALTAARQVVRVLTHPKSRQKQVPNPLVLHGPPGSGKSMLVQTLIRKLTESPLGLSAQALPAKEVPRSTATAKDAAYEIKDLQRMDFLALEDVHQLPTRSIGDLCRLLDHRVARRSLTVVTSNAGPAGLSKFPRRLTSRLASGLVVQLEPISPCSRRTLIEQLARTRKLSLTDDAIDYLAKSCTGGGVRTILGTLTQLKTLSRGILGALDSDTVRDLLKPEKPTSRQGIVERIVAKVSTTYGVKPKDVLSKCRQRTLLIPRQLAMYLTRLLTKLSLPQIGVAFGGRDHTTVLHACRKIEAELKTDTKLKRTVRELKAELQ